MMSGWQAVSAEAAAHRAADVARVAFQDANGGGPSATRLPAISQRHGNQRGTSLGQRRRRAIKKAGKQKHGVRAVIDWFPARLMPNGEWRETMLCVLWRNGEISWQRAAFFGGEIGFSALFEALDAIIRDAREHNGLEDTASGSVLGRMGP